MTDAVSQLTASLKSHHYSLTGARKAVFAVLQDREPQSMSEVVSRCSGIDRASVYRTISMFEALGIVHRLNMGWKYKLELSGAFMHHHHHMTCTTCGSVTALPEDSKLEDRLHTLADTYSFTPHDHQIEITGVCLSCQFSPKRPLSSVSQS
jgi:Fur family ferric uptake transcriptional regulator